jgi:hypothetical protein
MSCRSVLLVLALSSFGVAACSPSTTFQHVDVAYTPSASVHDQPERLVGSAVEYRQVDLAALTRVDGRYLGEIVLRGSRGNAQTSASGPANLLGRASLEAAAHGATHLMLVAGDAHEETTRTEGATITDRGVYPFAARTTDSVVVARFALYRVEHDRWGELPEGLRPRSMEPVESLE